MIIKSSSVKKKADERAHKNDAAETLHDRIRMS